MVEIFLARARQINAIGQELPKQSVGVLVAAGLPWLVRISKSHVDIQTVHQLWVARQLRASVVGQTGAHGFWQLL